MGHGLELGEEWLPKEERELLSQEREVDAGWQDKETKQNEFKKYPEMSDTSALLIRCFNKPHKKETTLCYIREKGGLWGCREDLGVVQRDSGEV